MVAFICSKKPGLLFSALLCVATGVKWMNTMYSCVIFASLLQITTYFDCNKEYVQENNNQVQSEKRGQRNS